MPGLSSLAAPSGFEYLIPDYYASNYDAAGAKLMEAAKGQAEALAENLARRLSSEVQTSARQTMEMLAKSFGAQAVRVVFSDAEPRQTQLVDAAASAAS